MAFLSQKRRSARNIGDPRRWGMTTPHQDRERLLRTDELAAVLNATPETIRRWAKAGVIPSIRLRERVIRFDLAAVRAALADATARNGGAR